MDETLLTKNYFIASRPYYHDTLTWCVRKQQPIPHWRNFFRQCEDPWTYLLFTLMILSANCMFYFLYQFEQRPLDWHSITLDGIRIVCGCSSEHRPQFLPTRILYSACLWGSVILTVTLLAVSLEILTNTIYEDQVKSIQEIIDQSFQLTGEEFALKRSMMEGNEVYFAYLMFHLLSLSLPY